MQLKAQLKVKRSAIEFVIRRMKPLGEGEDEACLNWQIKINYSVWMAEREDLIR